MPRQITAKIPVACSCGLAFEVPQNSAGRTIECSGCAKPLPVPDEPPASEVLRAVRIAVLCHCGKRLKAPASREGQIGKCPSCGRRVRLIGHKETAALSKAEWLASR